MLCDQRANIPELVNPAEFITMYHNYATSEAIYRAKAIYDEYRRQEGPDDGSDSRWYFICMLGAIYEAGRLQGKREERSRCRKR